MTMETAMIKAIREFKKAKLGEIRTIAPWDMYGDGKKVISVTFHIEYCEEPGAEYKGIICGVSEKGAVLG